MAGLLLLSVILLLEAAVVYSVPPLRSSIVGGQDAEEGQWPWMAYLYIAQNSFSGFMCGGSLVNQKWVLTASHCFKPSYLQAGSYVLLGAYRLTEASTSNSMYRMSKVVLHPNYTSTRTGDDIALVQLDRAATLSPFVRLVNLASQQDIFDKDSVCWVTGWGKLKANEDQSPDTLQEVRVPIVPNNICKRTYHTLLPTMLCAGDHNKDSCQGDSGGPLVCNITNQWLQVGVVSYGKGCGEQKYPGVYTRVSSYTDFIHNNIGLYSAGY